MNNSDLFKLSTIKAAMSQQYHKYLTPNKFKIFYEIPSTNTYLLECANHLNNEVMICLAETQTAGRGQFDRTWISPHNNIYLSLLWYFDCHINLLSMLSIEVATTINNALLSYGIKNCTVKWPNDILWNNRKLAGILIETRSKPNNTCYAVIGIGLNINISSIHLANAVDLTEIMQITPNKNKLTGILLEFLLTILSKHKK